MLQRLPFHPTKPHPSCRTPPLAARGGPGAAAIGRWALAWGLCLPALLSTSLAMAQELVQACRQRSLPLILDLDDALFSLPAEHPERESYAPAIPRP